MSKDNRVNEKSMRLDVSNVSKKELQELIESNSIRNIIVVPSKEARLAFSDEEAIHELTHSKKIENQKIRDVYNYAKEFGCELYRLEDMKFKGEDVIVMRFRTEVESMYSAEPTIKITFFKR